MDAQNFTFISLKDQMPPIIPRKNVEKFFGGLLTERMMANMAWRGEGPKQIRVGRNVAYETEVLLEWLDSRVKEDKPKTNSEAQTA